MKFKDIVKSGFEEFKIEYNSKILEKIIKHKDMILEWNKKINLTAIRSDEDMAVKHYIDSLSINKYVSEKRSFIDVGTGAGFPGIPISILNNRLNTVLLDSLKKRVNFLNEVVDKLEIKNVKCIHGRAEEFGVNVDYREKFEVATARALTRLPVLLEYCLPYVKVNGIFIAMKGSDIEEVGSSNKALKVLGGEIVHIEKLTLPCSKIIRNVIIIQKIKQLSTKYPRKPGIPRAKPLM